MEGRGSGLIFNAQLRPSMQYSKKYHLLVTCRRSGNMQLFCEFKPTFVKKINSEKIVCFINGFVILQSNMTILLRLTRGCRALAFNNKDYRSCKRKFFCVNGWTPFSYQSRRQHIFMKHLSNGVPRKQK